VQYLEQQFPDSGVSMKKFTQGNGLPIALWCNSEKSCMLMQRRPARSGREIGKMRDSLLHKKYQACHPSLPTTIR
jgi:hypothetical protein